ncbi:MAG: hypothetical protein ACJATV_001336 [Granulosicoccus sp.]|jgi:hypothetical protein
MTTTDNGETIPFIVRRERSYQARGILDSGQSTVSMEQAITGHPKTADFAGTIPDVLSTATQFADYHILLNDFEFRADAPDKPEGFDGFMQTLTDLGNTVTGFAIALNVNFATVITS